MNQNLRIQLRNIILIFLLSAFSNKSFCQEDCDVKLKNIKGIYRGECSDKKANGKGKSIGIDEYEGDFKNGYPEGKGTYVWQNGSYFIGWFIKGNREGEGQMFYESSTGGDSIISGFWKKDKYIGKYSNPYKVLSYSSRINKVDCTLRKGENNIEITAKHRGGTTSFNTTQLLSYITNINIVNGSYHKTTDISINYASRKLIQDIAFPFEATIYLSNGESTRLLFNEQGNYEVFIDMF